MRMELSFSEMRKTKSRIGLRGMSQIIDPPRQKVRWSQTLHSVRIVVHRFYCENA